MPNTVLRKIKIRVYWNEQMSVQKEEFYFYIENSNTLGTQLNETMERMP